ncbi:MULTISPECIES: Dam family site-specific DNA-(adenine-N6)-methyltransferase [Xanthomonas]|uniref:Site-specific DNA-methyltransferase (adenine-specific) n=2 Tax=Xanthomonas TaxID=338 RepID=A0ABZ0DJ80_9XANT|nr:Dam family site-specific DNA-(adenine-N6)-methyltransferase [Xanthomonas dyei]WOB28505.1 Dam family site-specific DNA-(adenine-N6)-methyltransferase [Xanthomonas dyei]WOB56125.1 Dam family site-specific DNA-(adenine-N6)-methyltransferase [Xanthomonas dyei]
MRSPIRWAGSKRRLLPLLVNQSPKSYERYVEPFCGSMCLLAALRPTQALVGDINQGLIHFYRMVRWRPRVVAKLAHSLPNGDADYYAIRAHDTADLTAEERAARFLYLNRYCFNGVYRTNKLGNFNVPRGTHTGSLPSEEDLVMFGRLLKDVELQCVDFEKVLNAARSGDFIYLDPPYVGRDVRDRGEYGSNAFKFDDFYRFREAVESAAVRGAKVLVSYADLPIVRESFSDWTIQGISVARNVSGFARGRMSAKELLIRNYR